jgi:hypothetical protein
MIRTILLAGAAVAALTFAGEPALAAEPSASQIDRLIGGADETGPRIDYDALDTIWRGIVFDVGHSDRQPPSRRPSVSTGTLIQVASNSRYRYEGNRVIFHLLEDVHTETVADYARELAAVPDQVSLSDLPRNEQLAYWLNLHNVTLVDMIVREYPVRRLDQQDVDGVNFFDAPAATVDGVTLSLNDIRFNIVQAGWDDPRVIYGFHLGAVGGASLRDEAFTGARVWSQLESNAREFVNALRGVDTGFRRTQISPLYRQHAALFDGIEDLKAHLRVFAEAEVDALIDDIGAEPDYLEFDWSIADMTNGRNGCSGPSAGLNIQVTTSNGSTSNAIECNVLPPQAADLLNVVIERRLEFLRNGDIGRVTVRDIPTDEQGNRLDRPGAQDDDEDEDEYNGAVVNLPGRDGS